MFTSAPIRVPLGPIPLSRFDPSPNTLPSPISLPSKRNAPAASSSHETIRARKLEREGYETVKRSRTKEVTPKAKAVLERDDLGIGKSPARRLFVHDGKGDMSLGISGAIAVTSTSRTYSKRALAPSPPIELRSNAIHTFGGGVPAQLPYPNQFSDNVDVHDPGFTIHADDIGNNHRPVGVGIGTPKSKRNTINTSTAGLAQDAMVHIPSSASSSRSAGTTYDGGQENIPPTWSTRSTSLKHSERSFTFKSGRTEFEAEEETYLSSGGSGRKRLRKIERSKLGLESVMRGEVDEDHEGDEGELTPGRREIIGKGKGKARLTREVDRI